MNVKIITATAGLALAICSFSGSASAAPESIWSRFPSTSNGRITTMMNRVDQFEQRQHRLNDYRLYVSRDTSRLASNATTGAARLR